MACRATVRIRVSDCIVASAIGLVLLAGAGPAGAASVQGVVLGPAGTPPSGGIRVEFRQAGPQGLRLGAGADAAGRFVLPAVPAGAYQWRVFGPEFAAEGTRPLVIETEHGTLPVMIRLHTLPGDGAAPMDGYAQSGAGTTGGGPWSRPVTATLIVLGAAIVVGVIVEAATDEEPAASPVTP